MNHYSLKNKQAESWLNHISKGAFTPELQKVCRQEFHTNRKNLFVWLEGMDRISVPKAEIACLRKYHPHGWNRMDEHLPPSNSSLRVEIWEKDEDLDTPEPRFGRCKGRYFAFWNGHSFEGDTNISYRLNNLRHNEYIRYRNWDN